MGVAFVTLAFGTNVAHAEDPNKLMPTEQKFVNDYDNILSDETKNNVMQINRDYSNTKQQPQIVLTTLKSTNGQSIRDFTNDLMARKDWKIGSKEYNNGVHILFAYNNGKNNVRINTGYGVEGVLPDATCLSIMQAHAKELKSSDMTQVDKGLRAVVKDVQAKIGDGTKDTKQKKSDFFNSWAFLLILIIASPFIGFLISLIVKKIGLDGGSSDWNGSDSTFDSGSSSWGGSDGGGFGGGSDGGGGADF